MAITVKDAMGNPENVSGRGMGIAGVTLGAIGTGLGLINNGVLGGGGLLGNRVVENVATTAAVVGTEACCFVSKDTFYQNLLNQANTNAANNLSTERRLSSIEAAVSQNAAVSQCNKDAIAREIEITQIIGDKNLSLALCRVPQGDVYLSPNKLADNYVAPSRVLDSYTPREYLPGRGFYGGQAGVAYGGYANGCYDGCAPCGGYNGF